MRRSVLLTYYRAVSMEEMREALDTLEMVIDVSGAGSASEAHGDRP